MGEKSGGSEGDVPLPALPYQGGSGPPRARIPAQTKDLVASRSSAGRQLDSHRPPCTLGARRGHFNLRQQPLSRSRWAPLSRQKEAESREQRPAFFYSGRWATSTSPMEPGPCAHPCGHGRAMNWCRSPLAASIPAQHLLPAFSLP